MSRGKKPSKKADLPKEFMDHINVLGGVDIRLVAVKRLHRLDLQQTFSILTSDIRAEFLTQREKTLLNGKKLNASVIDPSLNISCLSVRSWQHRVSKKMYYSLTNNWSSILKRNSSVLKQGALVQLWSFRCGGALWHALVSVDERRRDNSSRSCGEPLTSPADDVPSPCGLPLTSPADDVPSPCGQPLTSPADDVPIPADDVPNDRKTATMMRAGYLAFMYMKNGFVPSSIL